jgi:hypothetical protein
MVNPSFSARALKSQSVLYPEVQLSLGQKPFNDRMLSKAVANQKDHEVDLNGQAVASPD